MKPHMPARTQLIPGLGTCQLDANDIALLNGNVQYLTSAQGRSHEEIGARCTERDVLLTHTRTDRAPGDWLSHESRGLST
jgi:hypothetical protein